MKALVISLFSVAAFAQSPADVLGRDFYSAALHAQQVNEQHFPAGLPVFIGDSNIANLDLGKHLPALNFGIKGDTSAGVAHRIKTYASVKTARVVVIGGGVNDLGFGEKFDGQITDNYQSTMQAVPKGHAVALVGILPVRESVFPGYNRRSKSINVKLEKACTARPNCTFLKLWPLFTDNAGDGRKDLINADGVHLSTKGQEVFMSATMKAISQ